MSISPARLIARYLIDEGIGFNPDEGGTSNWPVYHSKMPATGLDDAVAVFNTGGRVDGRIMLTGENIVHPGILVMIRSLDEDLGWGKAQEVKEALDRIIRIPAQIDSEVYLLGGFKLTTPIIPLGEEEASNRNYYTINGLLSLSRLS